MNDVLLIEDDEALGQQVTEHLVKAGLHTQWLKTGRRLQIADLTGVSLVVLDLMLPGVHGLDILKHLRTHSDLPVLVLSARQDSSDKVRALQLGADDYMTKPFWPKELVERVRARLRRPTMQTTDCCTVGDLEIDLERRTARFKRCDLRLTRAEFDILFALARRAGRAIERDWLLENVLDPEREATQRTLDVHISRLRKKLADRELIETVWGIGYRLVAK